MVNVVFFLFILDKKAISEKSLSCPNVNIFDSPEQVFELPGAGDYID